jgi:hypothetical protein
MLYRYTVENAKEEIEAIRAIDSNTRGLIENVKVSRFDIMG